MGRCRPVDQGGQHCAQTGNGKQETGYPGTVHRSYIHFFCEWVSEQIPLPPFIGRPRICHLIDLDQADKVSVDRSNAGNQTLEAVLEKLQYGALTPRYCALFFQPRENGICARRSNLVLLFIVFAAAACIPNEDAPSSKKDAKLDSPIDN